ncbi:rod shape-determining protein MreC [Salisaeta longa]|uniref:rod shape-determining protein MreC n=1 Tax=Salisaeta longa TaxID=503170 RepID=UPI0003B68A45|nr:rod shape-determining protein MreC [Salisaeta longa]
MKLWEQLRDWVLLFGLLLAALLLMIGQNQPLVRGLRAELLSATARVEHGFAWMGRYFQALQQNEALRRENIRLSSLVARTRAVRQQNRELTRLLNLRDTLEVPLVPARIVSKDLTRQRNYFTINVGRADSIAVGMPVVNSDGILGTVVLVSAHYARVMSYLNTDFRVPAVIQPLQAEGIVRWDGEQLNRLTLQHIVKTEPVRPGQPVVTDGLSGVFPAGYPVGTVDSVAVRPGRNALRIYLRPAAPLYKTGFAVVLRTQPAPERTALEQRTPT